MNEKFCALRIANALQSHIKVPAKLLEPERTAEAAGAVNCQLHRTCSLYLLFYLIGDYDIIFLIGSKNFTASEVSLCQVLRLIIS